MCNKVRECNCKTTILLLLIASCPVYTLHRGKTNVNSRYNTDIDTDVDIELLRRIKGADIKSWMNLKTDPCANFYDYACGNWKRIHAAQVQNEGSISRFGVLSTKMERIVTKFISNLSTDDVIESKIRNFYDSCRNTKTSRSKYHEAMLKLSDEFGRFSFRQIDDGGNAKSVFNWWSTVAKIHKMFGRSMIIDIYVGYHFKTRNKSMIFMDQTSSFLSDEQIDRTKKYFSEIVGASTQDSDQLVDDMYTLDDSLYKIFAKYTGDFIEEHYSLRNLTELKEQYKDLFDVESFLKIALDITQVPQQIYVENCEYFSDLQQVLNSTKPETLENYILWQLMKDFLIDDIAEDIDSVCVGKTKQYFVQYLEHAIYQEIRSKEFEMEVFDLWHQIAAVFRDDLQSEATYHWMSTATREEAIKKLNNMKLSINSYDDINFEEYFKGLQISSSNYVENLRNILEHFELWRGTKLQVRSESVDDINQAAYTPIYNFEHNTVQIPVSIFLPFHVWHPSYPKSILYSDIGNTLAHELIHAFDDSNRQYDADGNANMWWDDNSIREYNEKRHCLQAQYQKYTLGGNRVRNMTDQSENICDNAAIRIGFAAYDRWLTKESSTGANINASELFRNLPYTSQELYFINFGQSNCEAITRETLIGVMQDETHAPDVLRVIVPLSNYPRFSEVFKCVSNAPMNPKEKCELY